MIAMVECSRCGISDKSVMLSDVITKEGIIKLCDKCCGYEDSPIIRKPTTFQLKEIARSPGTYERLARLAGLDPKETRTERTASLLNQEKSLKAVVDKNYQERIKTEAKPRPDLVDNFHWVLMRARRAKHITQKQLADAIGEPEAAIKKAEEGALPDNNYLLNKIQSYLKVNLSKEQPKLPDDKLAFSSEVNAENKFIPQNPTITEKKKSGFLTIFDLRKLKEEKDNDNVLQKALEQDEEKKKKEISDEDIHNLIFKKK